MFLNNSFNILPWYDSLEKQSSKKWYAFGQSWPLLCPKGAILPFQFVCEALEVTSNIQAVNVNTNEITDLGVAPSVIQGSQPNSTYYVVKLASVTVPALPVGIYYLRFNTSLGYLYSEEITIIDDSSECIKIQYWNEDTLNFASGEINFADNFKFEFYIRSTIGKPEYEFEEELTKRLGYKFIESQTSNKVYKFAFVAPEYICDAMRLIRLCDYVKLTTKFDSYNALSFAYEPKWQDQGDLAAVDVEFDTDCIIQKLESFNRRIKESFYNALLADIDEPVLFSTDTVAQYYTEFTTTSFINGKLIRQLESILPSELQSNFVDLVLPIDNMADDKNTAKKVSLSDLMSLVNSSDISKLFKGHFDADGNLQWIEALSHIGVNGGVTMFIDNGTMSLPQLYAGLPIDGRTLIRDDNGVLMINPDIDLGGGLTEVYWNDIKSKPTFATVATSGKYADLSGLPDLSVYALAKDLAKYVTLNTEQTIAAHKNFLNGLSVGGLGITKSQDDVVYIDANLVVRGGITMFGTNSVDVPTIMDAIATDGTNLKVVNGVLTFVGSIDGGEAGSVAWENVEGKPSWIGVSKPSYSYSEISGAPTLLSSFTNDLEFVSKGTTLSHYSITDAIGYADSIIASKANAYKVAGYGTTSGGFPVNGGAIKVGMNNYQMILHGRNDVLRFNTVEAGTLKTWRKVWHDGNFTPSNYLLASSYTASDILAKLKTVDGEGSGLDADLLDGLQPSALSVLSASKLTTARTIWGQSFDGTADVSGDLVVGDGDIYLKNNRIIRVYPTSGSSIELLKLNASNVFVLGKGAAVNGYNTYLDGNNIHFRYGTSPTTGMILNSSGNVLIGTTTDSGYKLNVNGVVRTNTKVRIERESASNTYLEISMNDVQANYKAYDPDGYANHVFYSNGTARLIVNGQSGNVGIGITGFYPSYKLDVVGDIRSTTNVRTPIATIDGIPIYKSQDDVLYIDGNLAVRGGITMYATDAIDVPSIIEALPSASSSAKGIASFNPNDFSVVDGYVSFIGSGGVDESVLADYAKKTDLSAYLPLSGGDINGDVNIYGNPQSINKNGMIILHNLSLNQGGAFKYKGGDKWTVSNSGGTTDYTILHSNNWSQYVTAGDGGNYLPLSGGTLNGTLSIGTTISSDVGRATLGLVSVGDNPVDFKMGNGSQVWSITARNNANRKNMWFYSYVSNNILIELDATFNAVRIGRGTDSLADYLDPEYSLDVVGPLRSNRGVFKSSSANILSLYRTSAGGGAWIDYYASNQSSSKWRVGTGGGLNEFTWEAPDGNYPCRIIYDKTYGTRFEIGQNFLSIQPHSDPKRATLTLISTTDNPTDLIMGANNYDWSITARGSSDDYMLGFYSNRNTQYVTRMYRNGNMLVTGGITMYSDIRKKTKLQDVELSLQQIADAPLIKHYYNSDAMRTTHVGSIAQYWAETIGNDWFCKKDSEGFYTMEIQNAALASAISIARELVKYESKTDKEIRLLKDEVKRLKKEIKILKSA